mgnify:CR=1 FL=1
MGVIGVKVWIDLGFYNFGVNDGADAKAAAFGDRIMNGVEVQEPIVPVMPEIVELREYFCGAHANEVLWPLAQQSADLANTVG